jgi:hypothetical protein
MFGPAAEHLLSRAIQQKQTVSQILGIPFYYPVIEEGVRTAFIDLNAKPKDSIDNYTTRSIGHGRNTYHSAPRTGRTCAT